MHESDVKMSRVKLALAENVNPGHSSFPSPAVRFYKPTSGAPLQLQQHLVSTLTSQSGILNICSKVAFLTF